MNEAPSPLGFLACNKPYGMTSRDAVNRVQRFIREQTGLRKLKFGHTGTLDPLASGVIVVAVGSATRLTPWVLQHFKTYEAEFRLGASSVSGDLEEPVTEHPDLPTPTRDQIIAACGQFQGQIDQVPPAHSAVWVDGRRAHQRARQGETFEVPKRQVWIESTDLLDYAFPSLKLRVTCGSGTYLRTLGIDLATRCGTTAVMTRLVRTDVGPFSLANSIEIHDQAQNNQDQNKPDLAQWDQHLQPAMSALRHLPTIDLTPQQAIDVRNGLGVCGFARPSQVSHDECVAVDPSDRLVAIMRPKQDRWFPYRVFPA